MRHALSVFTGFLLTLCTAVSFAQAQSLEGPTAIITGADDIAVGRTLVLDASASHGLGQETTYRWYIEGITQPISRTLEAVYTPERTGSITIRLVVETIVNGETIETEASTTIAVYERKIVILADSSVEPEKLETHVKDASAAGILLRVVQVSGSTLPVSSEESLFAMLSERSAVLEGAESIILWTDGITGLQALMRLSDADSKSLEGLPSVSILMITDQGLKTLARTARGPFSALNPDRIVITRKEAINSLIENSNFESFLSEIEQRDIDAIIVDESSVGLRPWNLLSSLVNFMLTHGVSSQIIILLLSLPLIAMILAFLKQIIGLTTFGLYTPSIVALSFLALGWGIGLAFLLFILITGYLTRALMRHWRILYIPKVAIIITVVSITLLLLLGVGSFFEITFGRDTIFILLIMSTLAESFLNVKTEEGWYSAVVGIAETILSALLCVFIVQWPPLQAILLAYPEIILLTILVDLILGRFTGLRVVEYFRFHEVFKHMQEE